MAQERLPFYGGQALIEGVLMRGNKALAAAMRTPTGEIVIQKEPLTGIYQSPIKKIPFLRGLILLWDSLGLGYRFLTTSANLQLEEEDEKIGSGALTITLLVSIAISIALFFLLPATIADFAGKYLSLSLLTSNLIEGLVRFIIVIGYIWGVGQMADIKRVFAYHGAEHKTINAFEARAELTPEIVSKFSMEHPRCGTGFLLTVVVLSVILFSFIPPMAIPLRLLSRLVLIPVLVMIAYEYVRWTAAHIENPLVKIIVRPNLWLQKLTTRQPDLAMLEVSISAFNAMYEMEQQEAQTNGVETKQRG